MSPEKMQAFVESLQGQIFILGVIILLFFMILITGRKKADTKGLVLAAIFVALYVVTNQLILFRFPQGGSITAFSMFTITYCGFLLGTRRGVMAGMCAGLLTLVFNPYVIHPIQLLLDYPLAVGALGFAGISCKKGGLIPGYLLGIIGRYFCVCLSGIIFFSKYTPEGWNAIMWSLYYNGAYIGAEGILTLILLSIKPFRNTLERLKLQL
ncbi:MAG: energy-coupled thiamine transporter ThiT [Anaerovoracaceae bacterium]|jgi:thiamine transporter